MFYDSRAWFDCGRDGIYDTELLHDFLNLLFLQFSDEEAGQCEVGPVYELGLGCLLAGRHFFYYRLLHHCSFRLTGSHHVGALRDFSHLKSLLR